MTWLRSALFNLAFFLFTALGTVLLSPVLLLGRGPTLALIQWWARQVIRLMRHLAGIELRVTGREHLPVSGPALIAAKHQSAFDTIVWLALLPRPAYVLKAELLLIPFYGWFSRGAGMIGVDRGAGAAAMRSLLRGAAAAFEDGRQVVIFPQGTRVPATPGTRARHPYQPGVAALYARSGLPVIPVATDSGRFWPRRSFRKRPGTLTVAILPPIPLGLDRTRFEEELATTIETASDALLPPVDNPVRTDVSRA
ncbi:lysophospholipid acyltransferase family protein [Elioraea rosea]|uniref:lysophospholipid acyltransferase family protein n=1 Tax=Elioraea rosea TaxID=2492390 RepID=UPI0011824C43|nr:lysophospholipid acyltransferase family protein [Elioraea rosea]